MRDYRHIQAEAAERVMRARVLVHEAIESRDPKLALEACDELGAFLEAYPDHQILAPIPEGEPSYTLPATAKEMVSKYPGTCSVCTDRFGKGVVILWDTRERKAICMRCSAKEMFSGR